MSHRDRSWGFVSLLAASLVWGCSVERKQRLEKTRPAGERKGETTMAGAQGEGEAVPRREEQEEKERASRPAPPGDRMAWFNEARFGMFIHWGVYAVPAGEWNGKTRYGEWIMLQAGIPSREYEKLASEFNPAEFDAGEWASLAKEAGMKYMVITAKHHDGFCMYDTALSDYSIVKAAPYGRDPMKDLARACREAGLRFCFYYSNVDWHHPEFPAKYSQRGFHGDPNPEADIEKYAAYMKGQVRELLTDYGPVGIMWFDGGGSFRGQPMPELLHAREMIDMIHEIQPDCLVNNRLRLPADYGTPEQHIPGKAPKTAFEVCMTLNRHWGYNKHDHDWKEPSVVIRNLVDIASKGGNYLLNVGPTAEGLIPPDSVRILREVGKWMRVNGEAIYGTTASPFDYTPSWGRVTRKGRRLFLHVFEWPEDGRLRVERLVTSAKSAHVLASGAPAGLEREGDDLVVALAGQAPDPIDTVLVLELEDEPRIVPKATKQGTDGSVDLKAADAIVHGGTARYERDEAQGKDNIGFWTDTDDWVSWWLELSRPGDFIVEITYACPDGTAGTPFVVRAADAELAGEVRGTGSWSDFRTFRLGTLALKAGRTELAVKPLEMPGHAVMNLKSVVLEPAR